MYVKILSTWEVWRALKSLELHSAVPRATLTPLSYSPNFSWAQYLDICTLTHELIVKLIVFGVILQIANYIYTTAKKSPKISVIIIKTL